ncbi:hypothetical protein OIE13_05960 [Streptosporangium sp. NBC_01810]|uniref:hypothetical protein n=1 Tax=Streptosporangium sp. NBC_01810 TaxID=2975951 RepID=UPI002DD8493B|nr:hypothetical protein [Streptosporangium sp. NBC_01810]WSA27418.1 hypothetical protein OIE13_05960 [Streptosporangium sp. NBC_01810]
MRVDLPGGQWAELIAPSDLRAGDMKAMRRDQTLTGGTATMGWWDAARDVLLRRVITAWSLDLPLPKDLPGTEEEAGSLDRVTIPVYQALLDTLDPYIALINGEAEEDPKPSSGSAGTSTDSPSTSVSS